MGVKMCIYAFSLPGRTWPASLKSGWITAEALFSNMLATWISGSSAAENAALIRQFRVGPDPLPDILSGFLDQK